MKYFTGFIIGVMISSAMAMSTQYKYIEIKDKIEWMGVLWFGEEIMNYPHSMTLPRRYDIIFGLKDNGTVVWKKVKIKNPKNRIKEVK